MMKKFLTQVALFTVGILCLLALAEYVARQCPNAYRIKQTWVEAHAPEVEVLVLGSSHAFAGIHAEQLGRPAYNLANSNQTVHYDWLLLSRDSARYQSLQTILYPTSSLLMDYPLEKTSEWYRCIYYQLYNHLGDYSLTSRYAWEVASIQTCCWKVQGYFYSGTADRMCDDYGWCTYYRNDEENRLTPELLAQRLDKYEDRSSLPADPEDYLDQIARLCERRGWRLLLIGFPVSELFASDVRGQQHLRQQDQLAREFAERHPAVSYYDFSADRDFTPQLFFDVDHLNDQGAALMSAKLKALLNDAPVLP